MLLDTLKDDLKQAQLKRDSITTSTLRLLLSEVNNARIAKGLELEDGDIIAVIQKEVKKRKEAAQGFRSGGREEQAQKEEVESEVLENYLPAKLSDEELTDIVEGTINELGANGISDMGKVIGAVMGKVAGRADRGRVSGLVREKLT